MINFHVKKWFLTFGDTLLWLQSLAALTKEAVTLKDQFGYIQQILQ